MKIERMVVSFIDEMSNIYVDKEEHLSNYNLERLSNIEVRVSMSKEEFALFREWKKPFEPVKVERKKKEEPKPASSLPDVF